MSKKLFVFIIPIMVLCIVNFLKVKKKLLNLIAFKFGWHLNFYDGYLYQMSFILIKMEAK